ncbi:hypothetical protein KYC5002_27575 [Archangium violaceum]|uniref:hypothetical protein n=1 Tax=Archangium violaceum TaxID=83451 RepID=UPI002B31603E|nr:hypothetical protein KYC5002_27575 [Archangium gephyra]
MSYSVNIVAVAARTPVGLTAESSAAAVRAGISRLGVHPFMVDGQGKPLTCARDGLLDDGLLGRARLTALATATLGELSQKLSALGSLRRPVPVLVALPETRPGFSDDDTRTILRELAANSLPGGGHLRFEPGGRGHAGALSAIEVAARWLDQGTEEFCIVLGVDGYLEAETLDWLASNLQLAGEGARAGFFPGEAAGALVLAHESTRRRHRLPALARVRGSCSAVETRLIKGDDEGLGQGLSQAITGAVTGLKLPDEALDAVYCDINGERYRTEEWGFAVLRTQRALRDFAYVAPVDCWGDVGAASGALSCVLATQAWARRYAKGPRALVWGSSESGLRAAAVLESSPEAARDS